MRQKFLKIFFNWLAVIIWLVVIYYFSSQPDLKSELEPFWDLIFRKISHAAEFFVLTYLFFRALSEYKFKLRNLLLVTGILSLIYAGFDEWHQGQVMGRTASFVDVGVDSVGVLVFMFLQLQKKSKEDK